MTQEEDHISDDLEPSDGFADYLDAAYIFGCTLIGAGLLGIASWWFHS